MYNRYIPAGGGVHTRIQMDETPPEQARERQEEHRKEERRRQTGGAQGQERLGRELFRQLTGPLRLFEGEDKNAGIAGILNALHLEELDSGDILLLLIMLFLFLEGDNLEMVITLGLMLLFGLGDSGTDGGDQKE